MPKSKIPLAITRRSITNQNAEVASSALVPFTDTENCSRRSRPKISKKDLHKSFQDLDNLAKEALNAFVTTIPHYTQPTVASRARLTPEQRASIEDHARNILKTTDEALQILESDEPIVPEGKAVHLKYKHKDHSNDRVKLVRSPSQIPLRRRTSSENPPRPTSANMNANIPINILSDKMLKKIFTFLNPSDLLTCRIVQRHWNALISEQDFFLNNIIYVVSIVKSFEVSTNRIFYNDLTCNSLLPFRHGRFQYIDYKHLKDPSNYTFRNSDNEMYFPKFKFLQDLQTIEFHHCFLLWATFKAYLIQASQVDSLKLYDCYISSSMPTASFLKLNQNYRREYDDFNIGNVIAGIKSLEIYERRSLENTTLILKKFNGYSNHILQSLKVSYHPPASNQGQREKAVDERRNEAFEFCHELRCIISFCCKSLDVLYLDIQDELVLDYVGYYICELLVKLGPKIQLKEFQLSPGLDCWTSAPEWMPKSHVSMTLNSFDRGPVETETNVRDTVVCLFRFLETQRRLRKLGLPSIDNPEVNSAFKQFLGRYPFSVTLRHLAVPSVNFLPEDLFHQFPNLEGIKIGGQCYRDASADWNLFRHYTSQHKTSLTGVALATLSGNNNSFAAQRQQWQGMAKNKWEPVVDKHVVRELRRLRKMKQLFIHSPLDYGTFEVTASNLTNLDIFEVNSGFESSVIGDEELQTCIKYMKNLRRLVISCADKITDFGLTGIPSEFCHVMFQNQKYHKDGVNRLIWTSGRVPGRPLSDMKGLRKLVLMGKGKITDIGIGYGVAFPELVYCYLPYSDNITSWGIEQLGESNPSLEILMLTGVNQYSKEAMAKLIKNHPRISGGDATRSKFITEKISPFHGCLVTCLPPPDELGDAWTTFTKIVKRGLARIY